MTMIGTSAGEEDGEFYPLSAMQQGMLFHGLRASGTGVDIEQILCTLPEPIAATAFRRAWQEVVERHPILRSSFDWEGGGEPLQRVAAAGSVVVPWVEEDWSGVDPAERETRLQNYLQQDRAADFDFHRAPLLRGALFRWGTADYRFLWTFHHALMDGRSFPLVLEEAFRIYRARRDGSEPVLPWTPRPYREYIEWLRRQDFEGSRGYWQEALRGFTTPTPIPVGRTVGAGTEAAPRYRELTERVDASTTEALAGWARRHGLTVNSLLQAAWAIVLSRYSGEEEVVFGATRACRSTAVPGAAAMVGLFINTLPLRVRVEEDAPLVPWLQGLRARWRGMREHEQTPLTKVQAWSGVRPGTPLFDSIVVFENYLLHSRLRALGGEWSEREFAYYGQTNFALTLMGYLDRELVLVLGYDQRRFDDGTVRRMVGHVRTLLAGMCVGEEGRVGDLSMLTPEERRDLESGWQRRREFPVERTLHRWFEDQVDRSPSAIAVSAGGVELSYEELNERANRVAHALRGYGVGSDVIVGLCLERSVELIVGLLGILKAGGAYLPIDLAYPRERLAFMLEDARAPVLLTQSSLLPQLPEHGAKVLCLDEPDAVELRSQPTTNPTLDSSPDDLAYIIFTSGSTGRPKGTLVTHRNVGRLFLATEDWFRFGERDVWTWFHSSAFDFSVWEIWGALLYGGRLVVVPYLVSRSPEAFYELLARERVTVLNQTPSAFRQLVQAEESVGPKELALRYVVFGGEALELQSLRPWFERHGDRRPQLVNMYGITETTVHVTYRPLSCDDLNSGSVIGVPIPDLEIRILDPRGRRVPVGVPGEMFVGGAGLARGYLDRPELTAQRFLADPENPGTGARLYRTGDLARFLEGRDIEYLGRIDQQVKIRGFRIELGEIESVLCEHAGVREAVVLARDGEGGKRLVGYVVSRGQPAGPSVLREHLRAKLPDYMVPAAFVFLDRLPLTQNGKIDRKALPEPETERPDLGTGYVEPRTPEERILCRIFAEVLRVERVGAMDHFFELGGDSILSIQVVARAKRAGLQIRPQHLLENPTVAALAGLAVAARATSAEQVAAEGPVALTPIQHWFFEQGLEDPHHYNQAFLFTARVRLERRLLEQALALVESHHDVLRLRFRGTTAAGADLEFAAANARAACEWIDLTTVPGPERAAAIESTASQVQAGLDLKAGPLWRAVYFDFGEEEPGRLLWVIHHLAVDGVSWRILLEDLESAYRSRQRGELATLPSKTTSFRAWAWRLRNEGLATEAAGEADYWRGLVAGACPALPVDGTEGENREAGVDTQVVRLGADETQALLQRAPAVYRTQINDLLMTALAQVCAAWTGRSEVVLDLEGHGREDLFEGVDLSRTVGWFTSIFPVRLAVPSGSPGEAIRSIKEQLRAIPRRGIGYGVRRYLGGDSALRQGCEPELVFNYLGQFDAVVAGLEMFGLATEPVGPWHGGRQRRRYLLEVNSRVVNGCLEVAWSYSRQRHRTQTIQRLADGFLEALRGLLGHCLSEGAGGFTPSDFPLARLSQAQLDRFSTRAAEVEDILPLSPMQELFYTVAARDPGALIDQWHATLIGPVDRPRLERAWGEAIGRHSMLRAAYVGTDAGEAVQVIQRAAVLSWVYEDWSGRSDSEQADLWRRYLAADRRQPLPLDRAPVMRLALVRLAPDRHKFLWTATALALDGWSWPVLFRDLSRLYAAGDARSAGLEPVRPYRDYLVWLRGRALAESERYWRTELTGFTEPTPLPGSVAESENEGAAFGEVTRELGRESLDLLTALGRRLHVTPATMVQAAWAIVLARLSGRSEVVFGAAFSGRPTDLTGGESIVGPFVTNLPVRASVPGASSVREFLERCQRRSGELAAHQHVSLAQVQSWSEVPWRHRLFDSLVVVQNYAVEADASRLGEAVALSDFEGPVHTHFPLTLLAEPGRTWRLRFLWDRRRLEAAAVARWADDCVSTLEALAANPEATVAVVQSRLTSAIGSEAGRRKLRVASQDFLPPQTDRERMVARVWEEFFPSERIGVEENLFDLGAHSLLVVRLHRRLREVSGIDLPLVALFRHPSIRSLARFLDGGDTATAATNEVKDRANRQREAFSRKRPVTRPGSGARG